MKPYFICLGAQKSATSTLRQILRNHPDIFLPEENEPHFFDSDDFYRGKDWYIKKFFSNCSPSERAGDMTPSYMFLPKVPERIFKTLGADMKLIFMLRNPANRAFSQYLMNIRLGLIKPNISFDSIISNYDEKKDNKNMNPWTDGYIERGLYAKHIINYRKYFPQKNMIFIIFEDFVRDIPGQIKEIYKFLKIDENHSVDLDIHIGKASMHRWPFLSRTIFLNKKLKKVFYKLPSGLWRPVLRSVKRLDTKTSVRIPRINDRQYCKLMNIFQKDIRKLESIINKELDSWKIT